MHNAMPLLVIGGILAFLVMMSGTYAYTITNNILTEQTDNATIQVNPATCYSPVGDCTHTITIWNKTLATKNYRISESFGTGKAQNVSTKIVTEPTYTTTQKQYVCKEKLLFDGRIARCVQTIVDANFSTYNKELFSISNYDSIDEKTNTIFYSETIQTSSKMISTGNTQTIDSTTPKQYLVHYKANAPSGEWFLTVNDGVKDIVIDPWWDNAYLYKKGLTITLQDSNFIDQNTTIDINLNTAILITASKMRSDCKDLEIIKEGTTAADSNQFQREVTNCNTTTTHVKFRPDYNINATDTNFYIYYGKALDTTDTNALKSVYQVYENFDAGTSAGWTLSAKFSIISGKLNGHDVASNSDNFAYYNIGKTKNFILDLNHIIYVDAINLAYVMAGVNDSTASACSGTGIACFTAKYDAGTHTQAYSGTRNLGTLNGWTDALPKTIIKFDGDHNKNNTTRITWNGTAYSTNNTGADKLVTEYIVLGVGTDASATIDVNYDEIKLQKTVPNPPIITFGIEESIVAIAVDFNYTIPAALDPENGVNSVSSLLTNLTDYIGKTIKDINWYKDSTFYSDGNIITMSFTSAGDYNVSLITNTTDGNIGEKDYTITVSTAPQGIDVNYTISDYNNRLDVNFSGSITTSGVATYFWGFPDGNSIGKDVNRVFTTDGNKNVCLTVQVSDANNTKCFIYYVGRILVHSPKDEVSGENLSPYGITVSGNFGQDFNYVSGDKNIFLFSTSATNYLMQIDKNNAYYPRNYVFILYPTTYWELSPYLARISDSIYATLYVFDDLTKTTLQNITIISKKYISGILTTVESTITDSTGQANLVLIPSETYYWSFYDGNVFVETKEVRPSTTIFYVFIRTSTTSVIQPSGEKMLVTFVPSASGIAKSGSPFVFTQTATNTAYEIPTSMTITITQDANNLYTTTITTAPFTSTASIPTTSVQDNIMITVEVTIDTNAGNHYVFKQSYQVSKGYDLVSTLQKFREGVGESTAIIIALIITILVVGWFGLKAGADPSALGIIALVMLGFFTAITWIPWYLFAFAAIGSIGMFLLQRRGGI